MNHHNTAKLVEISKALLTQTKQGHLTWVPTEKPDVFETNFPDYSIRIAHRVVQVMQTGKTVSDDYKVEIYDNEGRVIEEATSDEMKDEEISGAANIVQVLEELHELARGKALNTDKALDELLSRLSSA